MTKVLIAGNWKMNLNIHQASLLVHDLSQKVAVHRDVEVVLAPHFLALPTLSLQIKKRQFKLAAQNVYSKDHGAFTGEIAAPMLRGLVDYVIVGHSERRHVIGEHDKLIRDKVQAVLRSGLSPILCVGETADEKTHNETKHVLHDQITGGLLHVTSHEIEKVVIAYEPVWAIGTGKNATTTDLEEARDIIRQQLTGLFGQKAAKAVRILYGGSVNSENANSYLATQGIDGLLVGGASLNVQEFSRIVSYAHQKKGES
jgi:triosephosphate isomerase (TIM)